MMNKNKTRKAKSIEIVSLISQQHKTQLKHAIFMFYTYISTFKRKYYILEKWKYFVSFILLLHHLMLLKIKKKKKQFVSNFVSILFFILSFIHILFLFFMND